jgi:hypothetical protein
MLYKTIVLVALTAVTGILLAGCYKNVTIVNSSENEITTPVSFSNNIIPILNKSCNGSGCHTTGAKAPNLTAANAFNSLAGYINKENPKESELYLWMAGKKGTPMPLSGPDKDYNSLVLAWIKQGALNN